VEPISFFTCLEPKRYGGIATHYYYLQTGFKEAGIPIKPSGIEFYQKDDVSRKQLEQAMRDILIIHHLNSDNAVAYFAKEGRKIDKKVVVWPCDQFISFNLTIRRLLFENCFKLVASMKWWAEAWKEEAKNFGTDPGIIDFVRNEVRIGKTIPKEEAREKLGIETKYAVVEIGFVHLRKCFHEMVKILAPMEDVTYIIAGGTFPGLNEDYADYLRNQIAILKPKKVLWLDRFMEESDYDLVFSAADLALSPSIHEVDTQSTIFSSLGSGGGKTVIATSIQRGFRELDREGAIVSVPLELFSETIRLYLEDEKLRREQEARARAFAQEWTPRKCAEKYAKFFEG